MMKTESGKEVPDNDPATEGVAFYAAKRYQAALRMAELEKRAARAEEDPRYGSKTLEIIPRAMAKAEKDYADAVAELRKLGW